MKEFLRSMLSDGTDISSKRVCGILAFLIFLLVVLVVVVYLWKHSILENYLTTIFGALILTFCTFFGMTLAEMPWVK